MGLTKKARWYHTTKEKKSVFCSVMTIRQRDATEKFERKDVIHI